jgi:hypothetical protein
MSVDYTTYVGPYIQVHNPKRATTEEYHTCSNKSCRNHKAKMCEKFCAECGSAIKLVSFPCEASLDFDVYNEFEDKLAEALTEYKPKDLEDFHFFIGNKKGSPGISFDPKTDCYVRELPQLNIEKETGVFSTMFKKEIARLKEFFGADAVQIKWGVLDWAS